MFRTRRELALKVTHVVPTWLVLLACCLGFPVRPLVAADTTALTLAAPSGPRFTGPPQYIEARRGSTVTLTVEVQGTGPLRYAWERGGGMPPGLEVSRPR